MEVDPSWFFPTIRTTELRNNDSQSEGTPENRTSGILIYGPRGIGKTSLAFQLALHHAVRGQRVIYFCNQQRLHDNPPRWSAPLGVKVNESALSRIKFKYVASYRQIRTDLASLLLTDPFKFVAFRSQSGRIVYQTTSLRSVSTDSNFPLRDSSLPTLIILDHIDSLENDSSQANMSYPTKK